MIGEQAPAIPAKVIVMTAGRAQRGGVIHQKGEIARQNVLVIDGKII